jgi:signal peptidase
MPLPGCCRLLVRPACIRSIAEVLEERKCCQSVEKTAQEENQSGASVGYRIFSVVRTIMIYLLALVIVVAALLFAASRNPTKSLFGFRYYTVLTDSMVPEFASGDMVFVKLTDAADIGVNDIITFNPSTDGEAYLTHRVTEKLENYEGTGVICFRTKGDANDSEDSFLIDESRVIGTVKFHIPKLGLAVRFVQLRWYFILPLALLLLLFFYLMKYYFTLRGETGEEEEPSEQTEQSGETEKEE